MADKIVLDTHAVVWYLEGNPRRGAQVKTLLDDVKQEFVFPIIAFAEACYIIEKGRTSIPSVMAHSSLTRGNPIPSRHIAAKSALRPTKNIASNLNIVTHMATRAFDGIGKTNTFRARSCRRTRLNPNRNPRFLIPFKLAHTFLLGIAAPVPLIVAWQYNRRNRE